MKVWLGQSFFEQRLRLNRLPPNKNEPKKKKINNGVNLKPYLVI
jgi:hypothetical protein